MANRTVIDCDKCGLEATKTYTICVYTSSSYNGVDRDYWHRYIDLCLDCLGRSLQGCFDKHDCGSNNILLEQINLHDKGLIQ